MKTWPAKDPDEELDYEIDWSPRVGTDAIATSTWIVPTGITSADGSNDDTTTTIWLSGGTVGTTYTLTNRIVTDAGRTMDQSVKIKIKTK